LRTIVNASILISNDGVRLSKRFVVRVVVAFLLLMFLNMALWSCIVIYYEIKINKLELLRRDKKDEGA